MNRMHYDGKKRSHAECIEILTQSFLGLVSRNHSICNPNICIMYTYIYKFIAGGST